MAAFYLASRYGRLDELVQYRDHLRRLGHEVTSRWLNGEHRISEDDTSRWYEFAEDDLDDIDAADVLIHFSQKARTPSRGGRFVEVGYALALGMRVINVGPIENVFLAHRGVETFETWDDCLAAIAMQAVPSA